MQGPTQNDTLLIPISGSRCTDWDELQVTRENFDHVMPHVRAGLQQCLFYSFDCEFSGISATNKPLDYYASMQERYERVSTVSLESECLECSS